LQTKRNLAVPRATLPEITELQDLSIRLYYSSTGCSAICGL